MTAFSCRNNSLAGLENAYLSFCTGWAICLQCNVENPRAKLLLFGCSHFKALSLPLAPSHNASVLSAVVNSSVFKWYRLEKGGIFVFFCYLKQHNKSLNHNSSRILVIFEKHRVHIEYMKTVILVLCFLCSLFTGQCQERKHFYVMAFVWRLNSQ